MLPICREGHSTPEEYRQNDHAKGVREFDKNIRRIFLDAQARGRARESGERRTRELNLSTCHNSIFSLILRVSA